MTSTSAIEQTKDMTNGVDVGRLMDVIGAIEDDSGFAKVQWRATNQWIDGGLSRSRMKDCYGGNAEDTQRTKGFTLDADEPAFAAGKDNAPNSMECLLHSLASCLTGTLVYHAAVRGIEVDAVESSYKGDMDIRGMFGMSDEVRKGFSKVAVEIRVKSEASVEELTEMALFSPVYDIISNSLPVEFTLTKI